MSAVDSTNNYAMAKLHAGLIVAGSCFLAIEQTAGKGQRGKQWLTARGENITMSACFRPIHARFPFLLSAATALGCYDFIKECGVPDVAIKWPNDVFVADRKAAGVLVENVVRGKVWEWSVAGTGINLNQTVFGALSESAVSLRKITGIEYDVVGMGKILYGHLSRRYEWAKTAGAAEIMVAYNERLYKKDQAVMLKKDAAVFRTVLKSVSQTGELVTFDTMERSFSVGEVILVQ